MKRRTWWWFEGWTNVSMRDGGDRDGRKQRGGRRAGRKRMTVSGRRRAPAGGVDLRLPGEGPPFSADHQTREWERESHVHTISRPGWFAQGPSTGAHASAHTYSYRATAPAPEAFAVEMMDHARPRVHLRGCLRSDDGASVLPRVRGECGDRVFDDLCDVVGGDAEDDLDVVR